MRRVEGDRLLAASLAAIAGGAWLLSAGDPLLLTLWGIVAIESGIVGVVTGLGILLGFWE